MDEGDAVLAHSGGALGLFLGSLADFAYRGTLDETPYSGAGYGSAIGVLAFGTAATFVTVSPSRALLVVAGAGLGALAGAAAASPLLFENVTEQKTRAFVAATAGGTLLGGSLAWFLTRDMGKKTESASFLEDSGAPMAGVIGASATPTGSVPAYGVGWQGRF
jgi:hypothetical protein